jgi:hypothetical protein
MLGTDCPLEIWLHIIKFLSTRDVVLLSHTCKDLYAIAEHERGKRQDIDHLLVQFIDDPNPFRHLMRITGAILVGDFAMAFFTGQSPGNTLELLFYNTDWESCLKLWFTLFNRYSMVSECNLSIVGFVDEKVRSSSEI